MPVRSTQLTTASGLEDDTMDQRTRTCMCAVIAMAAGGFAFSVSSSLPTLLRAGVVGSVAGLTMLLLSCAALRFGNPNSAATRNR
jgi:hypothetical protein